jgi:hypothetical protein
VADGDVVARGAVIVPYAITEYTVDGEKKYDWYDSDQLYDTIDEAIQAFTDSVGG